MAERPAIGGHPEIRIKRGRGRGKGAVSDKANNVTMGNQQETNG